MRADTQEGVGISWGGDKYQEMGGTCGREEGYAYFEGAEGGESRRTWIRGQTGTRFCKL